MLTLNMLGLGLLLVAGVVSGVPTGPAGPQCSTTSVVAQVCLLRIDRSHLETSSEASLAKQGLLVTNCLQFNDLGQNAAANFVPVRTPYNGLYYQAFDASARMLDSVQPGVIPHSPPGYAFTQVISQTTGGTPMLSKNYPNSNVVSFSLESFYFSCVIQEGALTGLPTQCLINFTGYQGNDNQVANAVQTCSQQFQYNPSTMTGTQQMAFSDTLKSCFKDVSFVTITFVPPGGTSALAATVNLQIDDLAYSYKTC